jgi:hypothetical protein
MFERKRESLGSLFSDVVFALSKEEGMSPVIFFMAREKRGCHRHCAHRHTDTDTKWCVVL